MSEFVTFYSFKGGVGRTLALANVATLLAKDKDEPCRVLVWDFDLAAPGLQQVLKCKWKPMRLGFVDYVLHYLKSAEMPELSDYIHPTELPGVDILPAGFLDQSYASKLEKIRWDEIYNNYRGFLFVESLKEKLRQVQPKYDYVLVDSLTGYSDIGGICVQQIPGIAVLLFRLNDQNLSGISKVYTAIKASSDSGKHIETIPVISPSWPFVTQGSGAWYDRAKRIFSASKLLEVSFDPSVILGEKVIAKGASTETLRSRILQDYRRLTHHVRQLNPKDLRTMFERVSSLRAEQRFSEAIEYLTELITARPAKKPYWDELVRTLVLTPRVARDKLNDKAAQIFEKYAKQKVPYASIARAQLLEREGAPWTEILEHLSEAIRIDPEMSEAYFARGSSCMQHGAYDQALSDFSVFLQMKGQSTSGEVASVYASRATCLTHLHQWEKALADFDNALTINPTDTRWLVQKARILYILNKHTEALDTARKAELGSSDFNRIVEAHILAALGREDEALSIVSSLESTGNFETLANIAEVWLVVNPIKALAVLRKLHVVRGHLQSVAVGLKAIAFELLGREDKKQAMIMIFDKATPPSGGVEWEFLELRGFLSWGVQRSKINKQTASSLAQMIDRFEEKLLPKDRRTVGSP